MTETEIIALADKLTEDLHHVCLLMDQAAYQAGEGFIDGQTSRQVADVVIAAQAKFDRIAQQIDDLVHLARRMAGQRQSAIDSFARGWEAGLLDLQDQLSRHQFDELLEAITQIALREA